MVKRSVEPEVNKTVILAPARVTLGWALSLPASRADLCPPHIVSRSQDERDEKEEAAHISRLGGERFSTPLGRHGDRGAQISPRSQPGRREDHGVRA